MFLFASERLVGIANLASARIRKRTVWRMIETGRSYVSIAPANTDRSLARMFRIQLRMGGTNNANNNFGHCMRVV
jgi:hypothetical protein